jgi:PAS domain S-box-containing protein/putative nucleotidyltransferase with HDIG domain
MSGSAQAKTGGRARRGEAAVRPSAPRRSSEQEPAAPAHPQESLAEVLRVAALPVIEALSEGVVIQDAEGAVLAFNDRARRILGVAADELAGANATNPVVPFVSEDGAPLDPRELPTSRSLRSGESQEGVLMGVRRADGSVRWISVNSSVLRREDEERPFGVVGSFTDVTEFKEALRELGNERLKDLKRLATVAEYRDDDSGRHTERVARTAALVAMELGLDREVIWTLARAAPLHDVGKVALPDSILLKPGRLTDEELTIMKRHTTIGARILGDSDFPVIQMAREIALTHHERWDGGGYPAGLDSQSIPISGRIVAVADAFDAMAHSRPYKEALPLPEAVGEIEAGAGRQFDPEIVKVFLALDHSGLVES